MPLVYKKSSEEHIADVQSYNPTDGVVTVLRSDGETRAIEISNIIEIDMNEATLAKLDTEDEATF